MCIYIFHIYIILFSSLHKTTQNRLLCFSLLTKTIADPNLFWYVLVLFVLLSEISYLMLLWKYPLNEVLKSAF